MDKGGRSPVDTEADCDLQDYQDAEGDHSRANAMPAPVTLLMLIVIVIVFIAMVRVGNGDVVRAARLFGDKEPALIRTGQWWRLITPIFLHGSWIHLIVNGMSLILFGGQIERIYGARKYFLIYMVSGIAGNVLSYVESPAPSLGASGALFGLIGAGIVFPIRFRHLLQPQVRDAILKQLVFVAVINIGLSFAAGIDRYAHFGGILGGAAAAVFLIPDALDDRPCHIFREAALTAAALAMTGLIVVAGASQWNQARQETDINTVTYLSGHGNIALAFQLPKRWTPVCRNGNGGLLFKGQNGATIHIVDSQSAQNLYEETEEWRGEHTASADLITATTLQGSRTVVRDGGQVTNLCEFHAYGDIVEITLSCPEKIYTTVLSDFTMLLNTLRVVDPPLPHRVVFARPGELPSSPIDVRAASSPGAIYAPYRSLRNSPRNKSTLLPTNTTASEAALRWTKSH